MGVWTLLERCRQVQICLAFCTKLFLAVTKVFTECRESHLTPFDVNAHIKWCERSCQMVWALTSYGVRWLGKGLDGTYYSCFWACSARWTFNVNFRQWAVNASQCCVLTHAVPLQRAFSTLKGNGRQWLRPHNVKTGMNDYTHSAL